VMDAATYRTEAGLARYWRARRARSLRNGRPILSWTPTVHALARRALSELGPREWALDYGCGAGFWLPALLETSARVCAADLSPAALRSVESVYGVGGRVETAEVGPLGDGLRDMAFDLFWLHSVVLHWPDALAREIFGTLRAHASAGALWVVGDPPSMVDMRLAEPESARPWWIYPRTVFEIEDLSGLRTRVLYPSREICYAVLEAGE